MNQKTALLLILFFLSFWSLLIRPNSVGVKAFGEFRIHNLSTGLNYTTIQEAIDASETQSGQTISVESGVYQCNLTINKSLNLVGQGRDYTVIDANGTNYAIEVLVDDVWISDFSIKHARSICLHAGHDRAHAFAPVKNLTIENTHIVDNVNYGIYGGLQDSSLIGNSISQNGGDGITVLQGDRNRIINNSVASNHAGIVIFGGTATSSSNEISGNWVEDSSETGISLTKSENNLVELNYIHSNMGTGLIMGDEHYEASYNTIRNNTVTENRGQYLGGTLCGAIYVSTVSSNNCIYNNNIISNAESSGKQVIDYGRNNTWDNGYPSGGNFWDDYFGSDFLKGVYQNETGSDGLGDSSYQINDHVQDRYPLMRQAIPEFRSFTIPSLFMIVSSLSVIAYRKCRPPHRRVKALYTQRARFVSMVLAP